MPGTRFAVSRNGARMVSAQAAVFLYSRAIKRPLFPLMVHCVAAVFTLVLRLFLLGFSTAGVTLMLKFEGAMDAKRR